MTERGRVQALPPHTSLPDLLERFSVFFDQKIETIRNKLDTILCQDDHAAVNDARSPVELRVPASHREPGPQTQFCSLDPMPTELVKQHSDHISLRSSTSLCPQAPFQPP